MIVIRSLFGTVGVLLGVVLLVLGLVLAPVLLLLAPVPILVFLGWRFWRLRRQVGRGLKQERRRVHRFQKRLRRRM